MTMFLEQLVNRLLKKNNKFQLETIFFIICLMQIIYWLIKAR